MTPQIYSMTNSFRRFFEQHHPVIFISVLSLLLAAAIFALYQVLTLSTDTVTPTTSTISSFDKKTVEKIKQLHLSSDPSSNLTFPSPRSNPFVE